MKQIYLVLTHLLVFTAVPGIKKEGKCSRPKDEDTRGRYRLSHCIPLALDALFRDYPAEVPFTVINRPEIYIGGFV